MRVALIDPSLFTLPYDAALARGLQQAGCEVTLHGRPPRAADGHAEGIDLQPHFYPLAESRLAFRLPEKLRLAIKGLDHVASMDRLWRKLSAARPNIIHFQWLALPLIDARLLARFRKLAPLVLTVHDTDPFNGNPTAWLQRMGVQRALAGFDRLIVHTTQGRSRLIAQGIPAAHTAVLPHGSLSTASAIPPGAHPGRTPDLMQGPLTFLLFGKIKPYKGADVLIDAFAALPPALRAQARVRIVGQPYMPLDPLRARAEALGIADAVSIEPDYIADDAVDALFAPGTVAVFPYREIEASGVLSYAIANGRPIIASRLGSFAEFLRDHTHGRLVPPGDASALTAAMAETLSDRATAAAYAAAVTSLASDVPSWEQIARDTLQIYEDANSREGAGQG